MTEEIINNSNDKSDELILYNKDYVSVGLGISNFGNSCYFNSLIQCLLSCPSIYHVLQTNKFDERYIKNDLYRVLLELFETSLRKENLNNVCLELWNMIISINQKRRDKNHMYLGQQNDAHEGLMMIMDVLDYVPHLKILFEHRYKTSVVCFNCREIVVNKFEENTVFEIQPDLSTEQHDDFKNIDENYGKSLDLNTFLKINNGCIEDFKCPRCSDIKKKFKSTVLTMIPEILPILIKKYDRKVLTNFPEYLSFVNKPMNKELVYRLVSQSEHSGSRNGGHYWAISLRNENNILQYKLLNDSSVSSSEFSPTVNSYILFYHIYQIIQITK